MLRIVATTALLAASVSAVKDVVWAGRATGFDNADNWKGAYPLAEDKQDQPAYMSFGKEGGSITATTGAGTYVVGNKITLNGKVKIVLGDGKRKSTLSFAKGSGGSSMFLPGSDAELDEQPKMQGFDFNCHMNWRQAEDPSLYVTKPPCENDKVYMITDDDTSGSRRFKLPSSLSPGDGLFASTFGVKSYFRRMYISSPDEPGNAPSVGIDDCSDGQAVVSGSITVDLGVCNDRNQNGADTYIGASTGQNSEDCVSTCPPEGILEDGSVLQAIPDGDGGVKYIQIDDNGEDTDAKVDVIVDADGHTTFTVTDKDGTITDHIKYNDAASGSSIARKTTSSTTATATTVTATTVTTVTTVTTITTAEVTTAEDNSGGGNTDRSQQDGAGGGSGGNTTVVIVVVVVVVLIVIILAAVYVMKAGGNNGGSAANGGVVSFENPMYDTANKQNPAANYAMPQGGGGAAASSGYMDVPVGGGGGGGGYAEPASTGGYMDVGGAGGGGGGGYMDVAPNAAPAQGTSGYMDVGGGDMGGYGDSDEEDV